MSVLRGREMEKSVGFIALVVFFGQGLRADEGGAVAAGVAAGLFTGLATSAITNSGSSRSDKIEAQAIKAREETEQLRREQDRERIDQLRRDHERRDLERKDEQIRQLISQFNAFHDDYDDMNFTVEDLSTITARTLVVHGDRDRFFPVEIPIGIIRSIPDATLWIVPGGDHVPIFDSAVPFASTALRFLDGVDQKRPGA